MGPRFGCCSDENAVQVKMPSKSKIDRMVLQRIQQEQKKVRDLYYSHNPYNPYNQQLPYQHIGYHSVNQGNQINPYGSDQIYIKTQDQIRQEESLMFQKFMTQMEDTGVNIEDYVKYSGLFSQCPVCNIRFLQTQKPNLRTCGHFVCSNPFCIRLECVIPNCKQKTEIKILNYWPWIKQTNSQKKTYDFVIQYWGINDSNQIKKVDQNKIFQQIIAMSPFAKFFLQSIPIEHRALNICSQMILYKDIKNKTLKSQAAILKLKLSGVQNYKNKIHCYNKLLGGQSMGQSIKQSIQIELNQELKFANNELESKNKIDEVSQTKQSNPKNYQDTLKCKTYQVIMLKEVK